jgi:membrane protease YdiL (CAAX protease family)
MTVTHRIDTDTKANTHLLQALVGTVAFFALSLLSFAVPWALSLMVLGGIALPLIWGRITGTWAFMGFTRQNLGAALRWGLAAGLATSLLGFVVVQGRSLPPKLGLELAVAVPIWLLLASPFQEFFFRGWLQPRFEDRLGGWLGLLATTAAFTAWHYCWPLAAQSSVPLHTPQGFVATFAAGLVYGYSFQRTGSIVAPWLAHALSGIMFVLMGAGSFVGPMT